MRPLRGSLCEKCGEVRARALRRLTARPPTRGPKQNHGRRGNTSSCRGSQNEPPREARTNPLLRVRKNGNHRAAYGKRERQLVEQVAIVYARGLATGACAMTMLRVWPILLLIASNVFMTFAWYAHLKEHRHSALFVVVLASWGIAFFEYVLQVPANRMGMDAGYSLAQLKTLQEVITLCVFAGFSVWYFGESLSWNHWVGFTLIAAGAAFVFKPW